MRGMRVILITASFAAAYEYVWNMFAWFTTWYRNGGALDLTANTFHNHTFLPLNFNFATKTSFLIFAVCLYCWYFFQRLESHKSPAHE